MPRLVFMPTAAKVASTAPSTRVPTARAGRRQFRRRDLGAHLEDADIHAVAGGEAWTLPGFSAASSARQASR